MPEDSTYDLHKVFLGQQKVLKEQLTSIRESAGHSVSIGNGSEVGWRKVIEDFLPTRYRVSHGFVVDSLGKRSEQIDVIIHDRQYSPLLWKVGDDYFVPAESVYAVFEVKQDLDLPNLRYAASKASSVRRRHRTQADFSWLEGKSKQELNPILAGLLTLSTSWNEAFGDSFTSAINEFDENEFLSLGCVLDSGGWEISGEAGAVDLKHTKAETSLISFLMTLTHLLQSRRTVGGIDYLAYQRHGEIHS
jgi:hypothetical protein